MTPEARFFRSDSLVRWLGWLILAMGLAAWWLLDRLEQARHDLLQVHRRDELHGLLPLLRARDDPAMLTGEFLREAVRPWLRREPAALVPLQHRLSDLFGQHLALAVFDEQARVVTATGFPSRDLQGLGELASGHLALLNGTSSYTARMDDLQIRLFGTYSLLRNATSMVLVEPQTFQGRPGMFLLALLASQPVRLSRRVRLQAKHDGRGASAPLIIPRGALAMFVPARCYEDPQVAARLLTSPELSAVLPMWAGPATASLGLPDAEPTFAGALHRAMAVASQGSVVTEAGSGCFLHLTRPAGWVLVHHGPGAAAWRLARSPWLLAGALLLLGRLGLLWRRRWAGQARWPGAMARHFLQMATLAGLIPTLGLLWTLWARATLDRTTVREDLFRSMEIRMETLEQRHNRRLQQALTALKRFVDHPGWAVPPLSPERIESWMATLDEAILKDVYVVSPGLAEPLYGRGREASLREGGATPTASAKLVPFMKSLLMYTAKALKMDLVTDASRPQTGIHQDLQGGMLFEYTLQGAGPTNLLRLFAETERVIPVEMFGESTWSYVAIARHRRQQPQRLIFINMNRDQLQRQNFLAWVQEENEAEGLFPRAAFMTSAGQPFPFVFPEWSDTFPLIETILRQTARENGVQRLILPRADGGRLLCLARPLRGADFVVALLRRLPEDIPPRSGQGVVWVVLFYPFLVLGLAALLFHGFLLNPVRELHTGVNSMAAGQYEVRLPVLTDDEIGDLCRSFNRLAEGLREKEFLRRFISDLTIAAVERGQTGQTGQATRVPGTILLADIRSFTTLAEEHTPEEVVEMLNGYLTQMEVLIENQGGTIDKFIGDAILAVFLPVHGRDHPARRASQAALDMMRGVDRFNRDRQRRGRFPIAIGVGIATGDLLMGLLGRSDGRRDFAVTGPTVNRAAAMEKWTKQARHTKVVVCPTTADRLGEGWALAPLAGPDGQPVGYEIAARRSSAAAPALA
ncbi:MAG: Adenylate cyclase [Candidatus Ozemobacter sibiricus]|jgi:class 3 adenylate cyclase|uniref:Adenylate cyclase n=1 Tax=Candidatus Ozemobacter sibiricus TaxID=2268124 RepID=A0A367ZJX1_9BACT|nr:MAG: Adenylate cyclase [Candidatus Ozemobacter sibiricus]